MSKCVSYDYDLATIINIQLRLIIVVSIGNKINFHFFKKFVKVELYFRSLIY